MKATLDFDSLPSGKRYEDQYGSWLRIFQMVAELSEKPKIQNCPNTWAPLMEYLGAEVMGCKPHLPEDKWFESVMQAISCASTEGRLRELAEASSAFRPELVDALYKADMEWDTVGTKHVTQKEFKVTCNGSFFRPEVLEYIQRILPAYKPQKKHCVLVPCAADKPYPAPLHKAVRETVPDTYEIIIATGVLGLVPESLWEQMPLYDSGIPNEGRVTEAVIEFFGTHDYTQVAVYSDFYNRAIERGFKLLKESCDLGNTNVRYVTPVKDYEQYLPLMNSGWLEALVEKTHAKKE